MTSVRRTIIIFSSLALFLIVVGLTFFFSPYLATKITPPAQETPPPSSSEISLKEDIIIDANKIIVRANVTTASQLISALNTEQEPSILPAPAESPTQLPETSQAINPLTLPEEESKASPSPSAEISPLPASEVNVKASPSPTESVMESSSPSPSSDGVVQGVNTAQKGQAVLTKLASFGIQNVALVVSNTKKEELVTSPISNFLKTTISAPLDQLTQDPINRWFVLKLSDQAKLISVQDSTTLVPTQKAANSSTTDQQTIETVKRTINDLQTTGLFEKIAPVHIMKASLATNDPYFSSFGSWSQPYDDLWGLKRINVPSAWEVTTGTPSTVIAIVDSGIDTTHPDIADNLWTNAGEIGTDANGKDKKTNGVDDDNDGYVDDWHGWDFVNNDNNPTDGRGHGTHVAGIIAAKGNNGRDVTGVMWQAKIMPLQFLDADGRGDDIGAAAAIKYAADHGAKVINNSWGGPGYNDLIHDAAVYAYTKGSLLIAAAGNERDNLNIWYHTPANDDYFMAVSALTPYDDLALFSNFGSKIELTAPGGDNSFLTAPSILSLRAVHTAMGSIVDDQLTRADGTSMAAPYVSGVAGLIFSLHPDWTPDQVRKQLQVTADDIGPAGRDSSFGFGVVNAGRAVGRQDVIALIASPLNYKLQIMQFDNTVKIKGSAGGTGFKSYKLEMATDKALTNWTVITHSKSPVNNGVLGTIKTEQSDSLTFRLTVNPGESDQVKVLRYIYLYRPSAVFINNNESSIQSSNVTLTLWATKYDSKSMRIRNAGGTWSEWQPYTPTKSWALANGNGLKTVEVEYKYDRDGSVEVVSNSVALGVACGVK